MLLFAVAGALFVYLMIAMSGGPKWPRRKP